MNIFLLNKLIKYTLRSSQYFTICVNNFGKQLGLNKLAQSTCIHCCSFFRATLLSIQSRLGCQGLLAVLFIYFSIPIVRIGNLLLKKSNFQLNNDLWETFARAISMALNAPCIFSWFISCVLCKHPPIIWSYTLASFCYNNYNFYIALNTSLMFSWFIGSTVLFANAQKSVLTFLLFLL